MPVASGINQCIVKRIRDAIYLFCEHKTNKVCQEPQNCLWGTKKNKRLELLTVSGYLEEILEIFYLVTEKTDLSGGFIS